MRGMREIDGDSVRLGNEVFNGKNPCSRVRRQPEKKCAGIPRWLFCVGLLGAKMGIRVTTARPNSSRGFRWSVGIIVWAATGKQDLDGAIAEYREELRVNQDDAKAHHALGLALSKKGESGAALDEIRKAYPLSPGDAQIRADYGSISSR